MDARMYGPDPLPSSIEKIRSLNAQEYEALIDSLSHDAEVLARLDLHYQGWQVLQIRDHIVERRMRIKP